MPTPAADDPLAARRAAVNAAGLAAFAAMGGNIEAALRPGERVAVS